MAISIVNDSISSILAGGAGDTIQINVLCSTIQVFNRSLTDSIFVRLDGINPTVAGDGTRVVLPGASRQFGTPDPNFPEIRLISNGLSTAYTVECFP